MSGARITAEEAREVLDAMWLEAPRVRAFIDQAERDAVDRDEARAEADKLLAENTRLGRWIAQLMAQRDEWAKQCNMASEAQADAVNTCSLLTAERDALRAEVRDAVANEQERISKAVGVSVETLLRADYGMVAATCRITPGRCFCGVHISTVEEM